MTLGSNASEASKVQDPYRYTFTILTPTYNRAHILHRVYESLREQTFRDFEWLVVDDGSHDCTRALVQEWQKEASFDIRYFYQMNQGKHIAVNLGVHHATGEFLLIADSDDAFVPKTLERFLYHWNQIPESRREHFSGVACLCSNQQGQLVGDVFPRDILDASLLDVHYRLKVRGEKWWFIRTSIHRNYLFPETLKQVYLPEGLVWFRVAQEYKMRFVNEPLRIYYIDYKNPSIMKSNPPVKFAPGGSLWYRLILNNNMRWFRYAPSEFLRSAAHYARFSFHTRVPLLKQAQQLSNSFARLLWVILLPLGFGMFLKDRTWLVNK